MQSRSSSFGIALIAGLLILLAGGLWVLYRLLKGGGESKTNLPGIGSVSNSILPYKSGTTLRDRIASEAGAGEWIGDYYITRNAQYVDTFAAQRPEVYSEFDSVKATTLERYIRLKGNIISKDGWFTVSEYELFDLWINTYRVDLIETWKRHVDREFIGIL